MTDLEQKHSELQKVLAGLQETPSGPPQQIIESERLNPEPIVFAPDQQVSGRSSHQLVSNNSDDVEEMASPSPTKK